MSDAVARGVLGGRVWMYASYHCNLECTYCLTESSLSSARRHLDGPTMVGVATQAAALGFDALGVTGGEPFIRPDMPTLLAALADVLPVVVLSNGTLFTDARVEALQPLSGRAVAVQLSLDSAEAATNDSMRGDTNHSTVVAAVARLVAAGVTVRIASTVDPDDPPSESDAAALCALHRSLGVPDADHVVRPIVRRGRAVAAGLGVVAASGDIPPELTITAEGAYWSPFGPTVSDGRVDTDLLVTRTTDPLQVPAEAMVRLVEGRPPGDDARLGIR